MRAELRAALASPLQRSLVAVAVGGGAWAATAQGVAVRSAGALAGWQTAVGTTAELALVLVAVAAATSASTRRRLRVDELEHATGVGPWRRQRRLATVGATTGLVVLAAFSFGAVVAGTARAALDGTDLWATTGYDIGPAAGVADLAVRLAMGSAVLGAGAALAGWLTPRPGVAGTLAVVATAPFLTVAGGVAGRTEGVLVALSLTPVGALRAAMLGQQGLAVPGLEVPTDAWPRAAVAAGWLVAVAAVQSGVARRVHRTGLLGRRAGARRRGAAGAVPARRRPGTVAVGAAAAVATVVLAATVPHRANDHLPWRWQPAWREAARSGRASHQVVADVVDAVRSGRPAPPVVPAAVASTLQRGSRVEVAPESALQRPEEVPVLVAFDEPVATGAFVVDAVVVRFTLAPTDDGGWRIEGADGPFAASGRPLADAQEPLR